MFYGVEYFLDDEPRRVGIDRRDAAVPVATRGGTYCLMLLGQGPAVADLSPGMFQGWPEGNTVTLDMLKQPTGLWRKWRSRTRPVKIAIARFFYSVPPWHLTATHSLKPGEFLQGALMSRPLADRVYFVMVPRPGTTPEQNEWWPRIVGNGIA